MRPIKIKYIIILCHLFFTLINNVDNIYAQTTGIWLNKKNIPTVNGCSNATCDAQQTIAFAIGDSVFCGSNAGFYRYDRYTDTYITKQSINYISNVMANCSINGKGYILANAGGVPRIYEYNPISNSWSAKQQFPGSAMSAPAYFVLNNKLYIVSGVTSAYNSNTLNNFPVNEVWEYNPAVDVFLRKADINFSGSLGILLPSVPNKPRGFSIDNYGYVLWGPGAFYQYDPVIDVWYNKTSPFSTNPNIRYACQSGATCLIFNGFAFQGYGYCLITDLQQSQQNKAFLRYDPSTEQWTTIYNVYQVNGSQYFDNAVYSTSWTNTSRNVFGFYDENLYNSSNGRGFNCEWTPNDYAIYTSQVIQPNPPCIGPNENTNYQLQFTAVGNYSVANNIFYLQLSDANGNFNTPQNIDSIVTGTSTQYVGTFSINLPPSVWDTTRNYKLRVIATNPYSDDEYWTPVKKYIVLNPDTSVSLSGPTTFCSGSFVTIRPTTGAGYTYEWYKNGILINGVTSSSYSATSSGAYYCKITNSNGCSVNTRSITVNAASPPATPTISASGPTSFCQGGSVTLTSSSTTGNVWSTGATTQSITVTSSGTYTVTVSNGNCTSTSAATTITVNTNTAPTFNTYGPYCVGATPGTLPSTSTNGITGTWNPSSISTATAGTSTYTFTPTAGLCATTATRTVTVNANITPTFNSYGPYCVGATPGSLPTTSTNGITGTWSPSNISTANAGTSTYTFTPSAGLCATTATLTVTINANITPTFNSYGPYCVGATPGSLPTTSTNGITGTWSPSNISTANAGTSTYTFTPTAGLCATTATRTVTINANITPTFNSYGPYCVGATPGSLPTNSTNGITGTWSPSNINTANAGTSTYTFTPTAGLCATTASISVMVNTIPSTPVITPSGSTSLCPGGSVTLTSSSSTNNTWSTGALTSSIIVTTAGNYTVTVANGNCTATSSLLNVNLLSGVSIVAEPTNQTVNIGGIAQFIVSASVSPVTYQWQTNLGLGFQNLSNAGQYSGTDKDTLKVLNAALSNNNQQFRCIISSGGCSDTTNTVVLTVNNSTGINQSVTEQLFSVYPNPASGDVLIKTTRKYVGSIYTIRNLLGQILLSNKIMDETTIVNVNGLERGVYFIQVGEDLKRTVKLIKE